jgi:hypothetical protein
MSNTKKSNAVSIWKYIELFTALASFIAPILGSVFHVNASDTLIAVYIFFVLLGIVLLLRLWRNAVKAYIQKMPLPPPEIFWRILFNKLPPARGRSIIPATINILAIYDPSTKADYDKLYENFKSSEKENKLNIIPYEYPKDYPTSSITEALEKSQAAYLFLGQEIGLDKEFQATINSWSEQETQKPILVVEMNDQPYTLPFDIVPDTEARTGLWRLLSRSIERTELWYEQATSYRNVWIITFLCMALLLASTIFLYLQNAHLRDKLIRRDQSVSNHHHIIARDFQGFREEMAASLKDSKQNFALEFRVSEVKNAVKMISALKGWADPASTYLMTRFAPRTRELLEWHDATRQPNPELTDALIDELNCSLEDPDMHKSGQFSVSEEAQQLSKQPLQGEAVWRLNRMLLEDAYPSELSKQSNHDSNLKNTFQKTLDKYALYSFNEFKSRMSESQSGEGHMSFWRLSPDGNYYQQVARSHPGVVYRTFDIEQNPIVKCAIENNAFTLWTKDAGNGDAVAWSLDGETTLANWKDGNINFSPGHPVPQCTRVQIDRDDKTTGLLCVGMASTSRDTEIKSGLCIDVPYKDVEFLKEAGARNYLMQTLSMMHLIPSEMLKFHPECDKKRAGTLPSNKSD